MRERENQPRPQPGGQAPRQGTGQTRPQPGGPPPREPGRAQPARPPGGAPPRPREGGDAPSRDQAAREALRQRRGAQSPRERRFQARGSYRAQGGFALTIGTLMIFAAGALWGRWQDGDSPLNMLGAVICALCAALLLYAGWQVARPQSLLLTQRGGSLHRAGSATRSWQWSEADRVEWIQPARSRFATPEPCLVLRGYDPAASDAPRYLIPLTPFSEQAYAAIRERLLLNS